MRFAWLIWTMIILAGIGLVDASFLTIEHLRYGEVSCSFFGGCDLVTGSEYGQIGPVPTSALGVLYYGILLTGLLTAYPRQNEVLLQWMSWFTIVGFGASIGFVYIQLVVLRAICVFCMVSAMTSIVLFILGMALLLLFRQLRLLPPIA